MEHRRAHEALPRQRRLQVAADAVEHLEFESVAIECSFAREGARLVDQHRIVRGDRGVGPLGSSSRMMRENDASTSALAW